MRAALRSHAGVRDVRTDADGGAAFARPVLLGAVPARLCRVLERTDLVAVFGDGATAVLIHDDQTLTGVRRMATHVTVQDGRIVELRTAVGYCAV